MIVDTTNGEQTIQTEQHSVAKGSFLLVKVGSDSRPAAASDIEDIQKRFEELGVSRLRCLVTHHNVEIEMHGFPYNS